MKENGEEEGKKEERKGGNEKNREEEKKKGKRKGNEERKSNKYSTNEQTRRKALTSAKKGMCNAKHFDSVTGAGKFREESKCRRIVVVLFLKMPE